MASPIKIKATVERVVRHTDTLASYYLLPQGRVPKFHAGQFLHLALDDYHPDQPWPESRVFSIASAASTRATRLAVTIAVKGHFTGRIFRTLEPGSTCWLKLPYGEFVFPPDHHLTLIAGGVGITPYLSLLRQMLEDKSTQQVRLYYGVRSAEHYLFGDLIRRCKNELTNFETMVFCEDGSVPGIHGILDIDAIHAAAPASTLYYLSGPPAMISALSQRLHDLDVEPERVRIDAWE